MLISVLAGYPDRVARRRAGAELLLAGGGSAQLAPECVVRQAEFLVAIDAEERPEPGIGKGARPGAKSIIRLASAIEMDWLLDLFPDEIRESNEAHWSALAERVEAVNRLTYGQLILTESRTGRADEKEAARILAQAALATGMSAFIDPAEVEQLLARVEFMRRTSPEAAFQMLGEDDVAGMPTLVVRRQAKFCRVARSARGGELKDLLLRELSAEQRRLLKTMAPERVRLGGHRQVRVHYEKDQLPWIASRLQDFFGMREGPRIAGGRAALVLPCLRRTGAPCKSPPTSRGSGNATIRKCAANSVAATRATPGRKIL
ncbi:MAG: ATP-dependent helicase C-terminal domain-containing protein [Pyrinomonadaceae bacterium]